MRPLPLNVFLKPVQVLPLEAEAFETKNEVELFSGDL